MTKLIVRHADGSLGDPGDITVNMPSVSCGVCGQVAQIPAREFGVAHWDELYGGDRGELDAQLPPGYSAAQWEHDRELERWSQEHAATHTEAEHKAHAAKP